MPKKNAPIPLHLFPEEFKPGIVIKKTAVKNLPVNRLDEAHRDDYYLFLILEKGTGLFEIDFQQFHLGSSSVMIIQPYQVHRGITMDYNAFSVLMISTENINPDYVNLLKDIGPIQPLALAQNTFKVLTDIVDLCLQLSDRQREKLYTSLLTDSCNTLVAFIISQYLMESRKAEPQNRTEIVWKEFKVLLESDFIQTKQPMHYAEKLKISTAYLNECVKRSTGKPVSYHIQQRVILEAKRLLYHSNQSIKEIATTLGYEDYHYFCRVFAKAVGVTASAFRKRNLE